MSTNLENKARSNIFLHQVFTPGNQTNSKFLVFIVFIIIVVVILSFSQKPIGFNIYTQGNLFLAKVILGLVLKILHVYIILKRIGLDVLAKCCKLKLTNKLTKF